MGVEPTHSMAASVSAVSRPWMLILLLAALALTSGALFVRYKLEGLQESVRVTAEDRLGTRFRFSAVQVTGVRGFRIDDLAFEYPLAAGPHLRVTVPNAYVYVDLLDLLSGEISIDQIRLDGAEIELERPPDGVWFQTREGGRGLGMPIDQAFRVVGKGAVLRLINVGESSRLRITDLAFDVAKMHGSNRVHLDVAGHLDGETAKPAQIRGSYSAADSFDVEAAFQHLTAEDINIHLPAQRRFVQSGEAHGRLRLSAAPGDPMHFHLESHIEDFHVRNQPEFLDSATGTVLVDARYAVEPRILTLTNATARSQHGEARIEGSIQFAGATPALDLRLEAAELPVNALADLLLAGRADEYGQIDLDVKQPSRIMVALSGTTVDPAFDVRAQLAGVHAVFRPARAMWPEAELTFGAADLSWNSVTESGSGQATLVDGLLRHTDWDIAAQRLAGTLLLDGRTLKAAPLGGEITGIPFVASGAFDLDSQRGSFEVSGGMQGLEHTLLADSIHDTRLKGAAFVRANATVGPDEIKATAHVDGTQAEIFYNWWFLKPAGIGAVGAITATYVPSRSIALEIAAEIASSDVDAMLKIDRAHGKWGLAELTARSDALDIPNVGRCIHLPYHISGGTVTEARYQWRRGAGDDPDTAWLSQVECRFDHLQILPADGTAPFIVTDGRLNVEMNRGARNWGKLTLSSAQASTPAMRGGVWFRDPRALLDEDTRARFPQRDREWTFDLAVDAIEVPPWKGEAFAATAYHRRPDSGLKMFSAQVGGGSLEGQYSHDSDENLSHTIAKWNGVPARFLLNHLHLPPLLDGPMDGEVDYRIDHDDPDTRQGHGWFEIQEGQFSADYMISRLEGRFQNEIDILPAILRFASLQADIEFERDIVRTPHVHIRTEGVGLEGRGEFVMDGDMTYVIDATIAPEAAERVKPLRDALNLEGYRITQQPVELRFNVTGPLFNPQGQVAGGPPVSVTLVSGAFGVASEATKLIDIPRQILVDLLKLGGGLVGATR